MSISRVIEVSFGGGSIAYAKVDTAYFYNNGIIFKPTDIELPASYQVHWADSPQASSTLETIGTAEGAPIPDDLWNRSRVIYGWIYLHPTEDSGITAYEVRIYKNVRAGLPDGTEPTPAEQSTIDQLISALNEAKAEWEGMSAEAVTLPPNSQATAEYADGVLTIGVPRGADGGGGGGGGVDLYPATKYSLGGIIVGEDLAVTSTGLLSVVKANAVEKDNTHPITAAAVYTEVGNINALLQTI